MYFPYLRGKQYELSALRDYISLNSNNRVIPIVEPVKENLLPLEKTMHEFNKLSQKICIIVNPIVGELAKGSNVINESLNALVKKYESMIPTILLTGDTQGSIIESFLDNTEHACVISLDTIQDKGFIDRLELSENIDYHIFSSNINRRYRKNAAKLEKTALLSDCFPAEKKNANYPEDNPFSDEIYFFAQEGRIGFSDFTLLPNEFSEGGGPAWAVTIHLSYEKEVSEIRVRHFTSDDTTTNTDPGGKFLQALRKLIQWSKDNSSMIYESKGMQEFRAYNDRQHYPGLGYLKKISILHHLELCNNILNR